MERERESEGRRQHVIEVRIRGEQCGHMFPLSADVSLGVNVQADYLNANSVPLLGIGNKDLRSKCDPYHRLLQLTTCCAASFSLRICKVS